MASKLTAEQLNKALEGVDAECLDESLSFDGWWYDNDGNVKDRHATLIQEASMRNWLEEQPNVAYVTSKLHPKGHSVRVTFVSSNKKAVQVRIAPTRVEALAQACRAVKGGGA